MEILLEEGEVPAKSRLEIAKPIIVPAEQPEVAEDRLNSALLDKEVRGKKARAIRGGTAEPGPGIGELFQASHFRKRCAGLTMDCLLDAR